MTLCVPFRIEKHWLQTQTPKFGAEEVSQPGKRGTDSLTPPSTPAEAAQTYSSSTSSLLCRFPKLCSVTFH